ncbi:hypothetical protein H0H92_003138 [Tricholoma furcatifolium]|nr:hypothetical protein H0H92_003138 [Tricholoma furcatifolium]
MSSSAATIRLSPPFRAEHIGSLLRPPTLFEKRGLFEKGLCSASDLHAAEDEAIKHVIKLQQDTGIKTITDGELRRGYFFDGVFDNLEGMTAMPNRFMYMAGMKEAETVFCTVGLVFFSEATRLKSLNCRARSDALNPSTWNNLPISRDVKYIKITMCSPSWFHQRHGSDLTYDLSVYKNDDEYFDDLGIAYREEIKELYDHGCRHIQFDDPTFCYFCDENMISGMEAAGVDHEALLDTYIRAINGGVHFSEGGYGRIAEKVFNTLDVDTFYLEYDTGRAGDFAPLKHLPNNKVAVLGLVTTKNPKLESVDELKSRVNEAVDAMTKDNTTRSREAALDQSVLFLLTDPPISRSKVEIHGVG